MPTPPPGPILAWLVQHASHDPKDADMVAATWERETGETWARPVDVAAIARWLELPAVENRLDQAALIGTYFVPNDGRQPAFFGARLLVPAHFLKQDVRRHGVLAVATLAQLYNVTETTMQFRLRLLGFLP